MQYNPLGPNIDVIIMKNLPVINGNPSLGYLTLQKLHLFSSSSFTSSFFLSHNAVAEIYYIHIIILLYSIHYILYTVYTILYSSLLIPYIEKCSLTD